MITTTQNHGKIVCEVCARNAKAAIFGRDLCRTCYRRQAITRCARCNRSKRTVSPDTGLCPLCASLGARPIGACRRCHAHTAIYDVTAWLCRACKKVVHVCNSQRQLKQIKVACSICGKLRPSALITRQICQPCWRAERHGRAVCAGCKQLRKIRCIKKCLCRTCYHDLTAPVHLRRYVEEFTTAFPYNGALFHLLAETIDWSNITDKVLRRFRIFGRFLQRTQLPEPLTWLAIEQALPALSPTNRYNPKQIRASLLDLGYLLAAQGALESREVFVERRNAMMPLAQAPTPVQDVLHRYTTWLWERKERPANVRDHLEALAAFWTWAETVSIRAPQEVQTSLINKYFQTLFWQWRCSTCQAVVAHNPFARAAPRVCTHCGTVHSLTKEMRYAQNTLRQHHAKLLVFFDWAKLNRLVVANPVQRRISTPVPTITHYPLDVVRKLAGYVASPEADPVEALVLYLILFHALSVWELRHTKVPTFLALHEGIATPNLAEAYYVIVPAPEPSLGDRSPGRPDARLDFREKAAPWLKPLLERFDLYRRQKVGSASSQLLLVNNSRLHHETPVSHYYIWQLVRTATLHVLGATCSPNTLRKTAGVMLADRVGPGILARMGWDDHQAFAYTWASRDTILPQPVDGKHASESAPLDLPLVFPSPRNGRI